MLVTIAVKTIGHHKQAKAEKGVYMINRVVLVGRMTKEIELRKTGEGKSVGSMTLAVDRYVKDHEKMSDFIPCVVWGATADNTAKYTAKGSLVAVEGRIQVRKYQNKQGENRYATEVVCDTVQFLSRKESTQEVVENEEKDLYADAVSNSDDLPF